MITISLCMIVKNEEQIIARCLDCLTGIADEIIVVDTGSTDRTKEIVRGYTDKIFDFEWIDDFAAARNYSFSKATMEYIYVADADEIIDEENIEKFKNLKATLDASVDIVEMKYGNQLENGSTYNFDVENRPKLYKRIRTFHWIDPIHEVVNCFNKSIESDILITHAPMKPHAQRDLAIFEKVTKGGKVLSQRLHMMYARELLLGGTIDDFESAIDYFIMTLADGNINNEMLRITNCVLARYYNLKSDSDDLLKLVLRNMRTNANSEMCCELGIYYMNHKDYEEAIHWFFSAANAVSADLIVDSMEFIPNINLYKCFNALGETQEAKKYLELAKYYKPNSPEVREN